MALATGRRTFMLEPVPRSGSSKELPWPGGPPNLMKTKISVPPAQNRARQQADAFGAGTVMASSGERTQSFGSSITTKRNTPGVFRAAPRVSKRTKRSRDCQGANAKLRKLDNDGAKHSGHFSEQPRACPPREAQRLGAKEADWAVPQSLFGSGYAGSV